LALSGGRGAAIGLALTAFAVAIGTAILLFALSFRPALDTRAEHAAWRTSFIAAPSGTAEGAKLLIRSDVDSYQGEPVVRILVAGLNPHAGESGYLGREEIDVIAPVVAELAAEGIGVAGPFPADTMFTPRMLEGADAVLAMFHDQGLPVLKHASFGAGVNVTLGLPIVRTSVDHGTALDRAGRGEIDAGSLVEAVALAFEMAARPR